MGSEIKETIWPDHPVPNKVKNLIHRFFELLDSQDSNVGDILADEIFAPDAHAQFGAQVFTGTEADLLFIAWVSMDLKNGEHVECEFVGRLQFEDAQGQKPKIKSYGIWADSSLLAKAIEKK
ncbi:Type I inositol 1,4,5-trisphosphate 5-phosphatase 2 [Fusarium globosum]|uniref:Type I inositol 1,4,5-trisphosphate 5-phosphatase 2 n=1 Tax=Fusarium globosum TaxID=78864 RepID=A0A8H6CXV8_9HYPO|nr:Type I inositol 1,4,5-trisphosphate 5-phosphatase 2 [Fusarium globosum]